MSIKNSYGIGWWNVRMRKNKATAIDPAQVSYVTSAISDMKDSYGLDILFLGEIDAKHLDAIRPSLKAKGFRIEGSRGTPAFNLAVAFNPEVMNLSPEGLKPLVDVVAKKNRKVAMHVDVTLADKNVIRFYCLHWPSRIYNPKDSALRSEFASYLRQFIAAFRGREPASSVVVLGDFNEEPGDMPLTKLMATRDIGMVQSNDYLFYNPFWRFLVTKTQYGRHTTAADQQGTFYFPSGENHRWHVLDQMLFSPSFFGSSDWHLAEGETTIFTRPGICEIGPKGSQHIDHLPIMTKIEKD